MSVKRSRKPGRRGKSRKAASGESKNSSTSQRRKRGAAKTAKSRQGTSSRSRWRLLRGLAYWGTVAGIWLALIVGTLVVYVAATLPDPMVASLEDQPPNVTILAADGSVLARQGLRQGHVKLDELPPYLANAVLATEDRRFYYHFGVDPLGLIRAMVRNLRAGAIVEGGSTISQQLAKNLFLSHERTIARKFQEVILALWLEARFTKDEILELYLNRVYFGAGAYGVEAASKRYFDKSARHVTVAEAALLAGLLKAPSRYSPAKDAARAEGRASVVLTRMVDAGMLTPAKAMAALTKPADVHDPRRVTGYEYAVDWVSERLPDLISDTTADLVVDTSIDAGLQRGLQDAVTSHMKDGLARKAGEAAAVTLDLDGGVKAIAGGWSYRRSQFNRAIKSLRQPGSAFKPFVYLTALERGMKPGTRVYDQPINIRGWRPKNYSGEYLGAITMREALARSVNTVAVRLAMDTGRWRVLRTARRLGISSPMHDHPSIALGTSEVSLLELTSAYAPFANGGRGVVPHIVQRVRTAKGKVLYQRRSRDLGQVIEGRHIGPMNDMLNAVMVMGTGRGAALPRHPAAGKTGTSQNFRDAWFVGYTGHYLTGVWLGNDDGKPMKRVTGGSLPARIWKAAMSEAHRDLKPIALPGTYSPALADRRPARRPAAEPVRERRPAAVERPFLERLFSVFDQSG